MNSLPVFSRSEKAGFDFRVPDGLGHWTLPDWDDPDLKVEFRDAGGTVRAAATAGGDPPILQGNDYHETQNQEGGPFLYVGGIELASFAAGVAEAHVYARVSGVEVFPYPTVLAAFEVAAGSVEGPLYSTPARVAAELPGAWPEEFTEEMVSMAIAEASRKIDAFLRVCYDVPFPSIHDETPTPAVVETACRKLSAWQCASFMGRANARADEELYQRALSLLMRLTPSEGKTPVLRLPGYRGPVSAYRGELSRSDGGVEWPWPG